MGLYLGFELSMSSFDISLSCGLFFLRAMLWGPLGLHLTYGHVLFYTVSKTWEISHRCLPLDFGLALRKGKSDSTGCVCLHGSHRMKLKSGWPKIQAFPPWSTTFPALLPGFGHATWSVSLVWFPCSRHLGL